MPRVAQMALLACVLASVQQLTEAAASVDTARVPKGAELPTMAFALNMRVADKEWDTASADLKKLLDYALENKMTKNIEAMLRAGLEKVAAATITVKERRAKDAEEAQAKADGPKEPAVFTNTSIQV
jgi:hypothetical protein